MNISKLVQGAMMCVLAAAISLPALAAPKVGAPAPAFSGVDNNGKTQTLSDYKGKIVVLEWTNAECPFVKKFYGVGKMQELQKTYGEKGVVWLSVNSSAEGKQGHVTADQANAIRKGKNVASAATILDAAGTIGKLYEAKTTPHIFVIDAEGKIAYMGAIDDKQSADPEDIKQAKNYVVEALDALLAGKPVEAASVAPYGCSVKY
jgi:peroxiredoxin